MTLLYIPSHLNELNVPWISTLNSVMTENYWHPLIGIFKYMNAYMHVFLTSFLSNLIYLFIKNLKKRCLLKNPSIQLLCMFKINGYCIYLSDVSLWKIIKNFFYLIVWFQPLQDKRCSSICVPELGWCRLRVLVQAVSTSCILWY